VFAVYALEESCSYCNLTVYSVDDEDVK